MVLRYAGTDRTSWTATEERVFKTALAVALDGVPSPDSINVTRVYVATRRRARRRLQGLAGGGAGAHREASPSEASPSGPPGNYMSDGDGGGGGGGRDGEEMEDEEDKGGDEEEEEEGVADAGVGGEHGRPVGQSQRRLVGTVKLEINFNVLIVSSIIDPVELGTSVSDNLVEYFDDGGDNATGTLFDQVCVCVLVGGVGPTFLRGLGWGGWG